MWASQEGHTEIVKYLLQNGADPNKAALVGCGYDIIILVYGIELYPSPHSRMVSPLLYWLAEQDNVRLLKLYWIPIILSKLKSTCATKR